MYSKSGNYVDHYLYNFVSINHVTAIKWIVDTKNFVLAVLAVNLFHNMFLTKLKIL